MTYNARFSPSGLTIHKGNKKGGKRKHTTKQTKRKTTEMAGKNNNFKPIEKGQFTDEELRERARKGGLKSQQVQHEKKTLAQLFTIWANGKPKPKDLLLLESLGIDPKEATNKSLLIIPIIKNLSKGDTKALQMAIDLLEEDKRKEAEIKKLNAEIKRLELETEKLKNELNGDVTTNKIIIVNDVPTGEQDA